MPAQTPEDIAVPRSKRRETTGRPARGLERLVAVCLQAGAEDSRIGDLSEQYARTRERARTYLGDTPSAMTLSGIAADVRYLCSAANVILFARLVDRGLRPAERETRATIALDLRERAMTMLHAATRRLMLPALLLVGSAFLINGAVNAWTTWQETEALMVGLQREKAQAAAAQIEQYVAAMQERIAWIAAGAAIPLEQRRADYLRVLRQTPAIAEVAYLNADGREVLKVSRMVRDTVESGIDFSADPRFTEARKHHKHVGPIDFTRQSEPYVSVAVAHASPNAGVTVAEINLKRVWDIVDTLRVGATGYAYVVDGKGRVIASRDKALVLRQSELSELQQVAAASAATPSAAAASGTLFRTSISGGPVLSVHATVPTAGWKVFVEMPVAEARAPLWSALVRTASLLALGVLAIALASLASARRSIAIQSARI